MLVCVCACAHSLARTWSPTDASVSILRSAGVTDMWPHLDFNAGIGVSNSGLQRVLNPQRHPSVPLACDFKANSITQTCNFCFVLFWS